MDLGGKKKGQTFDQAFCPVKRLGLPVNFNSVSNCVPQRTSLYSLSKYEIRSFSASDVMNVKIPCRLHTPEIIPHTHLQNTQQPPYIVFLAKDPQRTPHLAHEFPVVKIIFRDCLPGIEFQVFIKRVSRVFPFLSKLGKDPSREQ